MTTTKEPSSAEVLSTVTGDLLKTDVLGRVMLQREAVLDAFEASGMTGQAFARQHRINIQTFGKCPMMRWLYYSNVVLNPHKRQCSKTWRPDCILRNTFHIVGR